MMPGFLKICQSVYSEEQPNVVFLKHNVFDDEEEEKTDLAKRLRVQVKSIGCRRFRSFWPVFVLRDEPVS